MCAISNPLSLSSRWIFLASLGCYVLPFTVNARSMNDHEMGRTYLRNNSMRSSNHRRLSEEPKSHLDKVILDDEEESDYETIHERLHIPAPAVRFALMGMMKVDPATTSTHEHHLLPSYNSEADDPITNATKSAASKERPFAGRFQLELSEVGKLAYGVDSVPTLSPTVELPESPLPRLCPTFGPSFVPRHVEDFAPTEDRDFFARQESGDASWKDQYTKGHSPGRARHSKHQLVHLEKRNHQWIDVLPSKDTKSRIAVAYGEAFNPFNILFDTSSLARHQYEKGHNFAESSQYNPTHARITALIMDIFPAVARIWSEALSIQAPLHNIVPKNSICGAYSIPEEHLDDGISADALVYVTVKDHLSCKQDRKPAISVCQFDQNWRPLLGTFSICLDEIEVQGDKVEETELLRQIASTKNLIGKFLGLDPGMFRYYRNRDTGDLWGEREAEVSCDNNAKKMLLSNVISQQTSSDGETVYEITSPTVRQVVRNHFDCQSMEGARLSAPKPAGNGDTCVFSTLDLRYHFDEDMTSISHNADAAFTVTPLSLALLEDSSWYRANFTSASTPSFGRAAGCGFVEEKCIVKGHVPDYSEGYFCNVLDDHTRTGCDYTHRNKAGCDVNRYAEPPQDLQYFGPEHSAFGSLFQDVDHCPMRSQHLVSCSSKSRVPIPFVGESFGDSSRCYETDQNEPICLETICSPEDKSLSFVVQGKAFPCRYHGELLDVGFGYSVVCPRIAAVCPDLVCPSNCSGKGVCDYCQEMPSCICDNPFDGSPGCFDS